jgi:hypothetical protein
MTTQKAKASDYKKVPRIPFAPRGSKDEFKELQEELGNQTDRGVAVLGASFLEWRVRQAIQVRMRVWDKNAESIFGTDDRSGELSFLYQCRMAYCLGLVGPVGLHDLEIIVKIRNKFAHQFGIRSFGHPTIREWCRTELKTPEMMYKFCRLESTEPPTEPRHRFTWSVTLLHSMIWSVAVGCSPMKWPKVRKSMMFW